MAPDDDPKDVKVKQLLEGKPLEEVVDEATARELEKWFGLPSFTELAERKEALPPEDPEMVEVRERRARAMAAVDPVFLDQIYARAELVPEKLLRFEALLEVHVDPSIAQCDYAMVEKRHVIAEPREVEISEELRDDMKDVTPQALLRDLHRPETEFEKLFEVVDMAAAQRLDIVAEVAAAMATNWKLPPLGASPFEEARRTLAADRELRKRPWAEIPMPGRRVTE